jgi:hypothetical protein
MVSQLTFLHLNPVIYQDSFLKKIGAVEKTKQIELFSIALPLSEDDVS